MFGRRLWLPEIKSGAPVRRQAAERAAINAPMQGTAADLIKLAMIAVQDWLDEREASRRMLIMQVHDELVLEVPDARARNRESEAAGADAVGGEARRAAGRRGRRRRQLGQGALMSKPRIFLGSSGKQEKLLQALTRGLEDVAQVEPWTTSFNPGTTTLERLLELAHEVDFAVFAFAQG